MINCQQFQIGSNRGIAAGGIRHLFLLSFKRRGGGGHMYKKGGGAFIYRKMFQRGGGTSRLCPPPKSATDLFVYFETHLGYKLSQLSNKIILFHFDKTWYHPNDYQVKGNGWLLIT